MSDTTERINRFLESPALLYGDEKGEAQVFCDRLPQDVFNDGYKEADVRLELRVKKISTKSTGFPDLEAGKVAYAVEAVE